MLKSAITPFMQPDINVRNHHFFPQPEQPHEPPLVGLWLKGLLEPLGEDDQDPDEL